MQASTALELSLMGQTAEARAKAIEQQQVLNKYIKEENEARLTITDPDVLQSKLAMINTQKLRAYLPGGRHVTIAGVKHWVCHRHNQPQTERTYDTNQSSRPL